MKTPRAACAGARGGGGRSCHQFPRYSRARGGVRGVTSLHPSSLPTPHPVSEHRNGPAAGSCSSQPPGPEAGAPAAPRAARSEGKRLNQAGFAAQATRVGARAYDWRRHLDPGGILQQLRSPTAGRPQLDLPQGWDWPIRDRRKLGEKLASPRRKETLLSPLGPFRRSGTPENRTLFNSVSLLRSFFDTLGPPWDL